MTRTIRSELLKLQTMPGMWVVLLLAIPLTVLFILVAFLHAGSNSFPSQTFAHVQSLQDRRFLLGAGFRTVTLLAPVLGVLCVTTEYRHQTITATLLLTPQRDRVLLAKVVATTLWGVAMSVATFVAVALVGLPWNAAMGGSVSSVLDQAGAVVPELLVATVLLALFGLGFGTLVKNQIAGVLVTIGGTLILEGLIVYLVNIIFHYDLNWLPNEATAAFAGVIAHGGGFGDGGRNSSLNFSLLRWWIGGIAMLGWGLVPLTIGYFTTFRKDVT
ncbi:MAG TPA: ABC transporter permease [Acidimicrobiales bacterium]|nr:ABC transporter permease [Acidimicrobiales bacterium]